MFYVHAQMSEHTQDVLLFCVHDLLVVKNWAFPLMGVLRVCPLSLKTLSSGVLNRALPHIWWRLYLPTFLLSVKLITKSLSLFILSSGVLNMTLSHRVLFSTPDFHDICDRVLFNTPELRINNDNGKVHRKPISGHVQSLPCNRHAHRTIEHPRHAQTYEYVERTS